MAELKDTVIADAVELCRKFEVQESVIKRMITRSDFGIKKYGVTLDREDLTLKQWLIHAQEELMDAVNYLEKLKKIGKSTLGKPGCGKDIFIAFAQGQLIWFMNLIEADIQELPPEADKQ